MHQITLFPPPVEGTGGHNSFSTSPTGRGGRRGRRGKRHDDDDDKSCLRRVLTIWIYFETPCRKEGKRREGEIRKEEGGEGTYFPSGECDGEGDEEERRVNAWRLDASILSAGCTHPRYIPIPKREGGGGANTRERVIPIWLSFVSTLWRRVGWADLYQITTQLACARYPLDQIFITRSCNWLASSVAYPSLTFVFGYFRLNWDK